MGPTPEEEAAARTAAAQDELFAAKWLVLVWGAEWDVFIQSVPRRRLPWRPPLRVAA